MERRYRIIFGIVGNPELTILCWIHKVSNGKMEKDPCAIVFKDERGLVDGTTFERITELP